MQQRAKHFLKENRKKKAIYKADCTAAARFFDKIFLPLKKINQ